MRISEFDYNLPEEKIALFPPETRGNASLLVLNKMSGVITHKKYNDIADYLDKGDVLVLNNTKVISARIEAVKSTGGKVELIVLEKHEKFSQKVLYKGHLKVNDLILVKDHQLIVKELQDNGIAIISSETSLEQIAEKYGDVPIPPYMKRKSINSDKERYQTVFAKEKGSVAAPTASLNFTEELEAKLISKGVNICYLTLHVGLGTFLPIRTDNIEEHQMHKEYFSIPKETINLIREVKLKGNKIAAIGTTVTRTLEFNADLILDNSRVATDFTGEADIFIYPGFKFKIVDTLITNFHAPKSTVLMLAAAFAGWDNLKNAYEVALISDYKFLSYGDSMLIS